MAESESQAPQPTAPAPLLHLAERLFDTPVAITEAKYETIRRALEWRIFPGADGAVPQPSAAEQEIWHIAAELPDGSQEADAGHSITPDGIAVISIKGTLVKKSSWANASSGLTSYSCLANQIQCAIGDPQVRGILFDIDSPGGETHGMFELGDAIYGARGQKPMYAIANDSAMSAAYLIASAADRIFVTRTGAVGSIGVFSCHVDESGADKMAGRKFTYIYAGDKKIDGNPHQPLSSSARADAQAETDRQYGMFVAAVARNRKADIEEIADTEAETFAADRGIPLLADAVGTFEDAYAALAAKVGIPAPARAAMTAGSTTMPVIPYRKTSTIRQTWDAGKNRKRLRQGQSQQYYSSAHAFRKSDGDPKVKGSYTFIHHEVSPNGAVGAANLTGCSTGIGILNGGRGGQGRSSYTPSERRGIYNHLAKHQKDAGEDPAPLKAYREYIEARLALGLIEPAAAREIHMQMSAVLQASPELMAEYSFAEAGGDTMPETVTIDVTDEDVLTKLKGLGLKVDDVMAMGTVAAQPPGDEDDDDDDKDKDKKPMMRGKKGKKAAAPKDKDPDDDGDDDEDEEDDKDDDKKAEAVLGMSTAQAIADFCEAFGHPEKTAVYLRKGYSLAQVRAKLYDLREAAANAAGNETRGFGTVKTTALEQMIQGAQAISRTRGIKGGAAWEAYLLENPELYAAYCQEKQDATANPGTSMAKAYADRTYQLLTQMSGRRLERILSANVGDAAGPPPGAMRA